MMRLLCLFSYPCVLQGKIYLWHFDIPNAIGEFCFDIGVDNPAPITRLRFNQVRAPAPSAASGDLMNMSDINLILVLSQAGNKFGASTGTGLVGLWPFRCVQSCGY